MLEKIVSGGQTGVDRAALDVALEASFPCGGYCPKGRLAEDGVIDPVYPLTEIDGGYEERTRKNVEASDGTLIVFKEPIHGGTRLTRDCCIELEKPYLLIDFCAFTPDQAFNKTKSFILRNNLVTLNVAGPRQSDSLEVYDYVRALIRQLCTEFPLPKGSQPWKC